MDHASGRILIVDDEPSLLRMMSSYLVRLGYSVTTAASAERGWSELEVAPATFSMAVLDATLAGMELETLARRMLCANPILNVLVASGYLVDLSAIEAAAPGRVGFLHKPFSPEMLAATVRRMVGTQD